MASLSRRGLLSALAVAPLAACTPTPGPSSPAPAPSPTPSLWPGRPSDRLTVDAAIFDGAFGTDYVKLAADLLTKAHPGVTTTVTPLTSVAGTLGPRFKDGATPPDLIDNSGSDPLVVAGMVDSFLPLDDVLAATNAQGETISDTLQAGVLTPGTIGDKLLAVNYALTVYGLWYSASLFAAQGWAVPTTWDELLALGETARTLGSHLFVWSEDAATYYQELAITSAVKEGGHDVRKALDNLEADSWRHPAVTGVLEQLASAVRAGYFLHGADGYLAAQALWSQDRQALLYPSGAWIAHEMADRSVDGFEMTVALVPTLTSSPMLPIAAIHSSATEPFLVPAKAANPDGGKALLQMLLSKEVAQEFSRTNLMPTVVRNSVPTDLKSSALDAQTRLLADAGENVFSWRFAEYYGLNVEQGPLWSRFLAGDMSAAALADGLQALTDRVRNDPAVERYTVS